MVRRSPAHEEVLDPFGRLARRAGRVDERGRGATAEDQESWDEELTDDDDPFDFEIPPGRAVVSPEARSDGREVLEARAVLAGAGTAAVNHAAAVDRGSADRARWPRADPDGPTTVGGEASPSTSSIPQVAPPAWLRLPSALRGATWSPAWTAVLAVVLAVAVAVGVFAVRVALAQAHARPEPVSSGAPSGVSRTAVPSAFASDAPAAGGVAAAGGGAAAGGRPTPGGTATGAANVMLVVDVVGEVARPGIVKLAKGSRVVDAVVAAGGPTAKAELSVVNQARLVTDGEQIIVPKVGAVPQAGSVPGAAGAGGSGAPGASGAAQGAGGGADAAGGSSSGAAGGGVAGSGDAGVGAVGAAGAMVDLNTADLTALDSLPGVGPAIAQRILDWRTMHGRFTSVDELGEVSGIGPKILERLRPRVRVG